MAKERNNLKAGIFILVSIALIVTVILSITGIQRIFLPEQDRTVSFRLSDDLGGLQVGDEVRIGGFKVGVVKSIQVRDDMKEVAPDAAPSTTKPSSQPAAPAPAADKTRLLVTFTLPSRYELHEDAVVGVQATITGTACLNISDLGTGKATDGQLALVGQPSALNALLATLGGVAPELKPMVADARLAVADVRTKTVPELNAALTNVRSKTVPELNEALSKYKGAGGHLEDMLGQSKTDFKGTVHNLKTATGTINEKLPGVMDAAHQFIARLDDTVKNTSGTLEDVKASMANFKVVSEKARDVVGGNKGKLDSMIASLKTTGDNLKAASAEIRHSPWRLLYKPGKGEVANLNLYDAARQFADGAGSLNDAALALRDALANKNADPEQVKELLKKLDESFANFRQVEDKLWTQVQQ
jgi:ABC-type transporter Mla subunit MlaD